MLRFNSSRLTQLIVGFVLLSIFFTASRSVNAEAQGIESASSQPVSMQVPYATKTPKPNKTRKQKKTRTPAPTRTATDIVSPSESPTATETAPGDATPTVTELASRTRQVPAPKQTARAQKTRQARKTRRAKKTRTATPTATPIQGPCLPGTARKASADISVEHGGTLVSPSCNVRVVVPPHAVRANAKIQIDEDVAIHGQQEVLRPFSLNVLNGKGGKLSHAQFDTDLEIEVDYDPETLGTFKEDLLDIAYFDEETEEWLPLKAILNKEQHTLTAEVDHFTTFALTSVDDVLPYLPTLQDFQTSLFTGASTASYAFDLPSGRGGLKPYLALAYSSSASDYFDSQTQASFVGTGWSLDTGYVARDTHNTGDNVDDFFSLVLNGASYELVPHTDGTYHTSNEQYYRITSSGGTATNPNTFTLWTKDGTKYLFGTKTSFRAEWWRVSPINQLYQEAYLWVLKSVTDRHGNTINYTYWKEQSATCALNATAYDTAIYPNTITYNGGLTSVQFLYESRTDRAISYPRYMCNRAPFQQSRLDEIQVKTVTASGGAPTLVKTYDLSYYASGGVFSGIPYTKTNSIGALTLQDIKTVAPDGGVLPAYALTYSNNRLGTATNGIGGLVRYSYSRNDDVPNAKIGAVYLLNIPPLCTTANSTPQGCIQWAGANQQSSNATVTIEKDCGDQNYDMQIWSTNGADAYAGHDVYPFQPGATYYVKALVQGSGSNTNAQVGVSYSSTGTSSYKSAVVPLADCGALTWTPEIKVQFTNVASAFQVRVHTTGKVRVKKVEVRKVVVAPWVVSKKDIEDGIGNTASTLYSYMNSAVNDLNHSSIVYDRQCQAQFPQSCTDLRAEPSTQFRGFETVRVGEPTDSGTCCSRVTEYHFAQDDIYKGQATSVIVRDGAYDSSAGNKYIVTTNTLAATNTVPRNPSHGDQSNFVFTHVQTVQTYDGDNAAAPKSARTEFDYTNYGDLKEKREYDNNNALYRTTSMTYNNNNDVTNGIYVVGLPNVIQVKDASNNLFSYTDNDWDMGWLGELLGSCQDTKICKCKGASLMRCWRDAFLVMVWHLELGSGKSVVVQARLVEVPLHVGLVCFVSQEHQQSRLVLQ